MISAWRLAIEIQGDSRKEWHRLVGEFSKLNLITNLDRAAVAA